MIISHKYKFVFVKTEKTAGTSIEVYLARHCGPDDIVTPIYPPVSGHEARNHLGYYNPVREFIERPEGLKLAWRHLRRKARFYNHITASLIRSRIPKETWNTYHKFCVERNPWDKVLSHYHMVVARKATTLTLDQYLVSARLPINYQRYTDPKGGSLIVDKVVRYEALNEELGELFQRLGIPFSGSLTERVKGNYRTDRRPYYQVMTQAQRDFVSDRFRKEIELHNYRFGE